MEADQLACTRLSSNQWPWCIQLLNGRASETYRMHTNQGAELA
jgi:hypothetical protein